MRLSWRLMWVAVLATLLVAGAAEGRGRRHRGVAAPAVLPGHIAEVETLKRRFAEIRDKVTLGGDAVDDCTSLSRILSDLATDPDPQTRQLVSDAISLCALDVPVAHSEKRLTVAVAQMQDARKRGDPDQMAPFWVELKTACDEANKTLKDIAFAGFSSDTKARGLATDDATNCVPANLEKPHSAGWSAGKIVMMMLLVVLLAAAAATATYALVMLRRRRQKGAGPGADVSGGIVSPAGRGGSIVAIPAKTGARSAVGVAPAASAGQAARGEEQV